MNKIVGEKGTTFLEVLLSLSLFVFIIATIMPLVVDLRKYEISWREKMKIQQEAMRFYTYLENRNSCYYKEDIQKQILTLYVCQNGTNTPIIRKLYFDRNKIYEQSGDKGYIELAQHVQSVEYRRNDVGIEVLLTLSYGNTTDTFSWILRRNLNR